MRVVVLLAAIVFAAFAAAASGSPAPTYTVAFQGAGSEHQVDQKQNIQDDGTCDAAEHVDVTATMVWSTSWPGLRASTKSTLTAPTRIDGSRVAGSHVKDACGLPLDQAPEGWVAQSTCDDVLVASGAPQLTVTNGRQSSSFTVTAPSFAVPVDAACPLNVRNDQLTARVVIAAKKLQTLKRGGSLTVPVGTFAGTGTYAPSLDCSVPTKPYEGYRTADHCQDQLSWSGTLKITRAS